MTIGGESKCKHCGQWFNSNDELSAHLYDAIEKRDGELERLRADAEQMARVIRASVGYQIICPHCLAYRGRPHDSDCAVKTAEGYR